MKKNHSIRKYLVIHLLLAICMTSSLTIVGNYYLDKKDFQAHLESVDPSHPILYAISQHDASTEELGLHIIVDDIYIMLFTFPLSGLLIWIIIGQGFNSLDRITQEVSNRALTHLKPVDLDHIPDEIRPLIIELNHLFQRLQEGIERENRFSADAAHELKTPLAAIKTQAQVALNAKTTKEKNEALHKLITNVDRGTHVVQQLLTMSQFMHHTMANEIQHFIHPVKLLREVMALLAPEALDKHIDLSLEQSATTIPMIKGHLTALSILFRNLIDNAIRYSPEHTQITVHINTQSHALIIEIHDEGPGIPKALHDRVFERFYRVLGHQAQGSGLGLGIVKQICEMHHATISLDAPEKTSGLIVRVTFPI